MKLRNKLIPLATVFATGVVLSPVTLTACGSKNGMVDLTNGNYVPTTKKAVTEGYVASEEIGTELWAAEVNEKPQTLIDDMLWYNAINVKGWADINSINITSFKALVKDVKINYVTIKIGGQDTKVPTVSMTFSTSIECNWYTRTGLREWIPEAFDALYVPWQAYTYDYNYVGKITSSVLYESTWNNIPIIAFNREEKYDRIAEEMYAPSVPHPEINTDWFFMPATDRLLLMDENKIDWSYQVRYAHSDTFTYTLDSKEKTKNFSSSLDRKYTDYLSLWAGPKTETKKLLDTGKALLESETFGSYYLSDITKK